MRKVAGVEARITELKAESNCKSQLSRDEALEFLAEVITTPAGAIGPHHRLCQAHKMTKGDGWEAHEVKLPDKMVAMQMVCRMCGWEKPTKFSLSGDDTLSTYLLELRRQPIGGLPAPDSAKPVNGTVLPLTFDIRRPSSGSNGEESH